MHDAERTRALPPGSVRAIELVRVHLPLVRPFTTASGTTTTKDALLVRVETADAVGWGECGAQPAPGYAAETVDVARLALRDHLIPRALAASGFEDVRGFHFAKAALGTALLDVQLQVAGVPLARHLGGVRDRVEAGVAVGIVADPDEWCSLAVSYAHAGYRRIKVKHAPHVPAATIRAVRAALGPDIALQLDANGSFTLDDTPALRALDDCGLQCIEQPLAPDALVDHAELARRVGTPICLDETITSATVATDALRLGACAIVNVKPGRLGGIAEARAVHDVCVTAGAPVLCGGMLETGLGRAVNVALASLPGFTVTGDLSASDRYFAEDLTEPFVLDDGYLRVPDRPGIGVAPRPDALRRYTVARERIVAR